MSNLNNNDFTNSTANSNPPYIHELVATYKLQNNRDEKKNHVKLKTPKERNEWKKQIKQPKIVISTPFAHWSLTSFVQFFFPSCFVNKLIENFNTIQMKNQMIHR